MENRDKIINILKVVRHTTSDIEKQADRICALFSVSKRSELLKAEDEEIRYDEWLKKYFKEPNVELVYRRKIDNKELTEKEMIRNYKRAYRL